MKQISFFATACAILLLIGAGCNTTENKNYNTKSADTKIENKMTETKTNILEKKRKLHDKIPNQI